MNVIQASFSGGEFSPALYARVDLDKYKVGAARMMNFFVDYRGGASNRTGSKFVGQAKVSSKVVHLIAFKFSIYQTYMLEFGDFYIRVIKDGEYVLNTAGVISSITQSASNPLVTYSSGTILEGDSVYFENIGGMTELNGRTLQAVNVTGNTFNIADLNGNIIDTSGYSAYTAGGTYSTVYTIISPYAAEDVAEIKFTQSADVLTLTHASYPQYDLTRTGHAAWTLTAITFAASIAAPTGLLATASANGSVAYAYVVTAVDDNGQESVASTRVHLTGKSNIAAVAGNITLSWNAVTGAVYYNVYKALPVSGVGAVVPVGANYGFMTDTTTTSATDPNIIPDFTVGPPENNNPFTGGIYPDAVTYFEQRQVYGAANSAPETIWMSKVGLRKNFDKSSPIRSDDSIEITLSTLQVNQIKFMFGLPGGLLTLTSGGIFLINGGSFDAPVTPTTVVARPQAYNGCSDVAPIIINNDVLYIQNKGSVVRDLTYNFYTNIYSGKDITVLSNHLMHGYTIDDWTFAEEPFKVVWAVRSDGKMLSLTFLKEQELQGWAHHETRGLWKAVSSIQEGTTDAVYAVVERYIDGQTVKYIERFQERDFTYGVEDAWFLDSALKLAQTYPAANISASAYTGTVTFTADAFVFSSGDVGKVLRMGGGIATITAYVSPTQLTGTFTRDITAVIPQDSDNTPVQQESGTWTLDSKVTSVTGLWHLEGQSVSALGDGSVFTGLTVTNGTVTLPTACSKIIVGIPYNCQLQTLNLDVGDPTIQGKRKQIPATSLRLNDSRGLEVGRDFDTMVPLKERTTEAMGSPIELISDDIYVVLPPLWDTDGRVAIQQNNPLPATVLGVISEVSVGDGGIRGQN